MKRCPGCKLDKDYSEFAKNASRSDGLQTECRSCKKSRMDKYYSLNKDNFNERRKAAQEQIKELSKQLKSVPCMDCGQTYPHYVMDFDHRPTETKYENVSRLVKYSKELFLTEVAKCDVVCANCHRERTHKRASVVQR